MPGSTRPRGWGDDPGAAGSGRWRPAGCLPVVLTPVTGSRVGFGESHAPARPAGVAVVHVGRVGEDRSADCLCRVGDSLDGGPGPGCHSPTYLRFRPVSTSGTAFHFCRRE